MKQREYTKEQLEIMKVLARFERYTRACSGIEDEIKKIKKDYNIEEPYLTLREYIRKHCCGAYHEFHFTLADKEVSIRTLEDMLTDDWCELYPLTNKFYVVADSQDSRGSNCENYSCDHYLTLEPKDD